MKSSSDATVAAGTGRECTRCAQALRPDWNFCPTCALPVGTDDEVLSPQIQVLRTEATGGGGGPEDPRGISVLRLLGAAGAGLLFAAVAGVGLLAWNPESVGNLLPSPAPVPTGPAPSRTEPAPATRDIVWVRVEGGEFKYGPPSGGRNWTDEGAIPAFEIMKFEVSNAQWMEYLEDRREYLLSFDRWRASVPPNWIWEPGPGGVEEGGRPRLPADWEDLPVRGVTFDQAQDFCRWLDLTGRAPRARMPREDEWEKAARGIDGRTYPWNGEFLERVSLAGKVQEVPRANVGSGRVLPVNFAGGAGGASDVSPFGVYNMGGNVSEWTDLWIREPGTAAGSADKYRVIRGASFQETAEEGAIFARTYNDLVSMERTLGALSVGFRAARDVPADAGGGGKKEEGR